MRRPLTSRERRSGAWLLLAAALAALYWLVVAPLFVAPLQGINEQMQTLGEQRQHYRQLLAQRQQLEQGLEAVQGDEVGLLTGDDPSAVAADLMQNLAQRIKTNASRGAGCVLTQRMPIVTQQQDAAPFRQARLSLDLDCGIEPLMVLLQQLESAEPPLFVDELNIRRANSAPSSGGAGRLTVHLLVGGYLSGAPREPAQ
ncbi:type II secretion system protein GspM [Pseudomonas putida]